MLIIGLLILGLVAGGMAGLVGVGGGVLIVPVLVYVFGYSQQMAQGTTLALLIPPIGIFAAYNYYKVGAVNLRTAAYIIIGFLIGSYISSHYATNISSTRLSQVFGVFLLIVGLKMIFNS